MLGDSAASRVGAADPPRLGERRDGRSQLSQSLVLAVLAIGRIRVVESLPVSIVTNLICVSAAVLLVVLWFETV